jgi:hypothetical protein
MKARGANHISTTDVGLNRIRYPNPVLAMGTRTKNPGSPGRKRCGLGVGPATSRSGAEAKALSPPPGKYGRKAET